MWLIIAASACCGCNATSPPAKPPAACEAPAAKLIAVESAHWSREEACAHLGDEKLGISAAVRLVRLAGLDPLCVPAELTDAHVARLRLVALPPERWALGLADPKDERRLRAPVLISADGDVMLSGEGVEEELAVLHVSKDPDVFPHLVTLPQRVMLIADDVIPAIALATCEKVRFELRREHGFSYVALVLTGVDRAVEVARYRWDPYELTFLGPARDKLPDPPGGSFQIDLEASRRMEPVGGEIEEPPKTPEPATTGNEWA
jgi:hypothetical protein